MPGLFRLIIIGLVIWLLYRLYQRWLSHKSTATQQKGQANIENMVRCEVCGLHVPQGSAVQKDGHYYCSEEHRRIGR